MKTEGLETLLSTAGSSVDYGTRSMDPRSEGAYGGEWNLQQRFLEELKKEGDQSPLAAAQKCIGVRANDISGPETARRLKIPFSYLVYMPPPLSERGQCDALAPLITMLEPGQTPPDLHGMLNRYRLEELLVKAKDANYKAGSEIIQALLEEYDGLADATGSSIIADLNNLKPRNDNRKLIVGTAKNIAAVATGDAPSTITNVPRPGLLGNSDTQFWAEHSEVSLGFQAARREYLGF